MKIWSAALLAVMPLLAGSPRPAATRDDQPVTTEDSGVRVYVGLWSTHIRDIGRGLRQNWLLGLGWRGYYCGTFINSFGNRSFTAGIQRTVARGEDEGVMPSFGFRLGLVSGYDERFMGIASKTPVLPMGQLLGSLETGRTGVEVGYAGLVATIGPTFRF